MAQIHISKDPLNIIPVSGKIEIFSQILTLRWKQKQVLFKLNGNPLSIEIRC